MSEIDRKRIAAVRMLETLGYRFQAGQWTAHNGAPGHPEADALHALLVERADRLSGCSEGSPEEAELASIDYAVQAYEARRWPLGKEPGGKG